MDNVTKARINLFAVFNNLKMQMRTGTVTAAAHTSDKLSLFYIFTGAYSDAAQMSISRLIAVIMFNLDITSIAAIPAGSFHHTGSAGINRRAIIIGYINTWMPVSTVIIKRIYPAAKAGSNIITVCRP